MQSHTLLCMVVGQRRWWIFFLALGWSCSGLIEDPTHDDWSGDPGDPGTWIDGDGPTEAPLENPEASCNPELESFANGAVRRLSKHELATTLRSVFGAEAVAEVAVWIESIPAESTRHSPGEFNPATGDEYVGGVFEVANRLGAAVSVNPAQLSSLADGCLGDGEPTDACVRSTIATLGERLFRRPLSEDEIELFTQTYGAEDEGIRTGAERAEVLIAHLVASPDAMFHIIDVDEQGEMSAFSIASRLSYSLTGAPPDAELLQSAASGAIHRAEERETQAWRIIESAAGRAHVRWLFQRWLGLHGRHSPEAAAVLAGVEVDGLYDELTKEALDFVEHVVFEDRGTYVDLMTSNLEFPSTERLASLLGEEPTNGAVQDSGSRAGLLTRPAMLISSNERTSPIIRGVQIWERFLCEDFPPPPMNADAVATDALAEIDPDRSTSRSRASAMTGAAQCQQCHETINAPGFALSRFGPLGEEWDQEVVYAAPGEVLTTLSIDGDDLIYGFELDDQGVTIEGAAELGRAIAESNKGQSCAARQIFRATHLREATRADACHVLELTRQIESRAPMIDVLVRNAVHEPTRIRREEP